MFLCDFAPGKNTKQIKKEIFRISKPQSETKGNFLRKSIGKHENNDYFLNDVDWKIFRN